MDDKQRKRDKKKGITGEILKAKHQEITQNIQC